MSRITNHMLGGKVAYLNKLTGNPENPWERKDGRNVANVGNYHISGAYCGVALHQMSNDGGGVRDVFGCGHMPKRELFNRISAFLDGIEEGQK